MPWLCKGLFSCCCKTNSEDVRELNFNHTSLKEVPSSVFAHERTLEELHLESNRIGDLPRALFHCHELRVLDLSDNELRVLPPAVASLINLKHLNLSKNSLSSIPDNIKCCKQLNYVNVSVNPLDKLPDGFTQLIALEELYLNDTFLEFLPANFGRLSRLRTLDLRENHLNTLPKSISRLANLQLLDIGRNEFSDLPEVVGNLPELRDLWADCNKIRTIPAFVGNLTKLVNFDVANNNIKWIAPEIEKCVNLAYFVLSGNELTNLPEEIGNLKNVAMLKVDENDLESLPRSIGKLTNLEEFVFSQNIIESIPPTIGLLRKVSIIIADDNRLSELPSELCSCASLRVLSVRNNELLVMPAEIGHLTGVKVINIADNLLRNLPVSVLNLTNLSALWLSTNQSTPLTTLQQEIDPKTGLLVCVNFLFPQQDQERNHTKTEAEDSEPLSMDRPPRHIRFADTTDLRNSSRLTRAPTPYPKELRSMAKHARILTTKPAVIHDGDEEIPLMDSHRKSTAEDNGHSVWPSQSSKSRTSLTPLRTTDRSQYDCDIPSNESESSTPLLDQQKTEQGFLPPPAESQYLGLPGPEQLGAGESAPLPADHAFGLISESPVFATRSDIVPPIPSDGATGRVEDGVERNGTGLMATLSMPATVTGHYDQLLTEQVPNVTSLENIVREVDLSREAGLNGTASPDGDPVTLDEAALAANALPRQVKVPPPYHIAAMRSKQAAYFLNDQNGQGTEESINDVSELRDSATFLGNAVPLEELKAALLDPSIPADTEGSTFLEDGLSVDVPASTDLTRLDFKLDLTGAAVSDLEVSPRSPPARCSIPVLKTKDAGTTAIPKLNTGDSVDNSPKSLEQSPRESPLSKIPSFSIKDPKVGTKKPSGVATNLPSPKLIQPGSKAPSKLGQPSMPSRLIQPSANLPTKLLQPGFHATQLPLTKSPTVIPCPENEDSHLATAATPANGNRDDAEGFDNGNGTEVEKSPSEATPGTAGFKSRIPARVSPVKGPTTPSSPTSPSWVFGQHKNPTVFPLTLVKNPGLGFSICGGTATPEKPDSMGIFVSKVQPNGPAGSALMVGDKILEVDGVDFAKVDHDQAAAVLKQTKNIVHLMISRQK